LVAGPVADSILALYGLSVLKSQKAKDKKEAVMFAKKIGFPIVMKIDSPDIAHKSDVGELSWE